MLDLIVLSRALSSHLGDYEDDEVGSNSDVSCERAERHTQTWEGMNVCISRGPLVITGRGELMSQGSSRVSGDTDWTLQKYTNAEMLLKFRRKKPTQIQEWPHSNRHYPSGSLVQD